MTEGITLLPPDNTARSTRSRSDRERKRFQIRWGIFFLHENARTNFDILHFLKTGPNIRIVFSKAYAGFLMQGAPCFCNENIPAEQVSAFSYKKPILDQ